MMWGIGAFAPAFISVVVWIALSAVTFQDLGKRAVYPYPGLHAGAAIAIGALFFLGLGMILCISRHCACCGERKDGENEEEEDQQEEEYQTADGDNAGAA